MKRYKAFILFLTLLFVRQAACPQGLQFYGNEKRIAERSSFRVFDSSHSLTETESFSLRFEYCANNVSSPGYVLYLKDAQSPIAYNLTYMYDEARQEGHFMFAQDGKQIYHTFRYPVKTLQRKWIPITLSLNARTHTAEISINHEKATVPDIGIASPTFVPELYFGMYNHILETASFSIRRLTACTHYGKWEFPLNESKGNAVHDSKGEVTGHIQNPVWLINNAYYWKPLFRHYSTSPAGFAFSASRQQFHIYNRDSIVTYDVYERSGKSNPYAQPSKPFPIRLGMNFMDEDNQQIYAYELDWEDTYMYRIDPSSRKWETVNEKEIKLQLHHHGGIYNTLRKQFILFGGYGNRKYSNQFIGYDLLQNHWDSLSFSGAMIAPRFFSGMSITPDQRYLYIYGGKGNEAGDQNIGIRYYYDLYRIDLKQKQISKLWEQDAPASDFVPVRDMILSADGKYLYTLIYPEYQPQTALQLYRISVSDGQCEALGNPIPMISEEIATNANLYFNPELNELYCVIQEFEKYGQTNTRIYTLSFPPVSSANVNYYDTKDASIHFPILFYVFCLVVAGSGLLTGVILIKRKKRNAPPCHPEEVTAPPADAEAKAVPSPTDKEEILPQERSAGAAAEEEDKENVPFVQIHQNKILLFGPFTAIDRHGHDITYMFSPKIKQLFLYILIHSITEEGTFSSDLNSLFWPDKADDKIKNLKNVTINHLRKVLQEIDGIELTYQRGYFKLILEEQCFCDFHHFIRLTKSMKYEPETEEAYNELLYIMSRGKFLNTINSELFDYSKVNIESFTVSFLTRQIKKNYPQKGMDTTVIRLCNLLFATDPVSDVAMTYQIAIYRRQNRHDKAIQLYNLFTKEYQRIMDENYPIPFEEVDIRHIHE